MADAFSAFEPGKEDIERYLDRFGFFLLTKNLGDAVASDATAAQLAAIETKKKAWLFRMIGAGPYQVLCDLCSPTSPAEESYAVITDLLKRNYAPVRNVNVQRRKFYARVQAQSESISEFAVALQHLAETCTFGTFLDQALQTQFINHLRSERIREKVIDGADTFRALVQSACRYELMLPAEVSVNWISRHNKSKNKYAGKKFRKKGGDGKEDKEVKKCFKCNKVGHFAAECFTKSFSSSVDPKYKGRKKLNNVESEECSEERDSNDPDLRTVEVLQKGFELFKINPQQAQKFPKRVLLEVKINRVNITMEIDTGAKKSVIGKDLYEKHFSSCPLRPAPPLHWGGPLHLLGKFDVDVELGSQKKRLNLRVVDGKFPALFGLPWMEHIRLPWSELVPSDAMMNMGTTKEVTDVDIDKIAFIKNLSSRFPSVFKVKPGVIKNHQVNLRLKEGATPVFYGPRTVSVPLRKATKEALDEMERNGFIEKCAPGPWGIATAGGLGAWTGARVWADTIGLWAGPGWATDSSADWAAIVAGGTWASR
jgi:hypothetical protein